MNSSISRPRFACVTDGSGFVPVSADPPPQPLVTVITITEQRLARNKVLNGTGFPREKNVIPQINQGRSLARMLVSVRARASVDRLNVLRKKFENRRKAVMEFMSSEARFAIKNRSIAPIFLNY